VIFDILVRWVGPVIGYHNLQRIGKFLFRAGSLDYPNSISANGEEMIQHAVLSRTEHSVIIDCGANTGQWSVSLLSAFDQLEHSSTLRLVCFEPSTYTHELLSNNLESVIRPDLTITVEKLALSSQSGETALSIVHPGAGVNSLVEVPGTIVGAETITRTTLTNYAASNAIDHIDLLKIDAEGHDMDVMLGAMPLFIDHAIKVVQFEYNWRWIYSRHFLKDAFELLRPNGYEIFKITPLGLLAMAEYKTDFETFIEGNYIACLPDYTGFFKTIWALKPATNANF
jgi:FkbM family methyltransferase